MTFKKDSKDNGFSKPLTEELIPECLLSMAKVLQFGGNKYGYQNWRKAKKKDFHHYQGAAMRHFLQWQSGEKYDNDTGESHLIHAMVNLMFLYWHTEIK